MFTGSMGRIAVFCSYAREDEAVRRELEGLLVPLRDERIIDDWYDNRIQPGARWNAAIESALDRARLMIFIVTPNLLASRYVADVEIPKAIERERSGLCQVVPLMIRQADWSDSPLAQFQALPGGGRWMSEYANPEPAYRAIAEGLREVCKRIVDWENPYKHSQVGDWTFQEQTMTVDGGQSLTAQGTEELISKNDREAVVRLEMMLNGQLNERTVTIDLTQPLEDRMGDMLRQTGTGVPANLEISLGPAQYADEKVNIGGRTYETIRARRTFVLAQRGTRFAGQVSTWRSIDVPLYGTVKGESEIPGMRQYQVLLDFGHGDAAARKPRLTGGNAGYGAPQPTFGAASPPAVFGPGRWQGQMNAFGVISAFDLIFYPNGALQGQQTTMGTVTQLQGQWFFDIASGTLTCQIVAGMMGMPVSQETVQMRITGTQGAVVYAQDMMGRQFALQRIR
jgi:hypothetical protein